MAIDHSQCEHEKNSKARAKCRRAQAEGDAPPRRKVIKTGLGATPRSVKDDDDNYGQTPRDRDKQCMNCGVEKIEYKGTDPLSGLLLYVGEKCEYIVRRSLDKSVVEG